MVDMYQYEYSRAPSALRFMPLALVPKKGLKSIGDLPEIIAIWKGCRPAPSSVQSFAMLTGIHIDTTFPPLFLHTISFRLLMSVLTCHPFPVNVLSILQTRNVIIQRRAVRLWETFDISASVAGCRVVQKGLEIDVRRAVSIAGDVALESITTFYMRGDFGAARVDSGEASPDVPSITLSTCSIPHSGEWAFGKLTGDYNGIHMWNRYAKLFGFKGAFSHPQRVLGEILKRLPTFDPVAPSKLEIWLKGPVYYGSSLDIRADNNEHEQCGLFSLHVDGDARPAIVGRYSHI